MLGSARPDIAAVMRAGEESELLDDDDDHDAVMGAALVPSPIADRISWLDIRCDASSRFAAVFKQTEFNGEASSATTAAASEGNVPTDDTDMAAIPTISKKMSDYVRDVVMPPLPAPVAQLVVYAGPTSATALSSAGATHPSATTALFPIARSGSGGGANRGGHSNARKNALFTEPRQLPQRTVPIMRDPTTNAFVLPIKVGIITVTNLGCVVSEPDWWHNERYIWPEGFEIKRPYQSLLNPDRYTTMTARIERDQDNPSGPPLFTIEPEDEPGRKLVAQSPTGAWVLAMRQAQILRGKDPGQASVSGPDYFGFSHPTVAWLIQELPGARACSRYQWQTFVQPEDRPDPGPLMPKERGPGGRWLSGAIGGKKRRVETAEGDAAGMHK